MQIQIFQIKVNDGRRRINQEAVQELANSISEVGLLNPITVDQDYTLISGLHRLEAAKHLGWTEIKCNVSSLDGLMAELAEIDENLVRRGLDYIDEGKKLERRKEIYEMLHPETRRGKRNGQTSKGQASKSEPGSVLEVVSFSRDTAQKTGVSPRTIEQKIQVAKNLTPETTEIVKEHGIGFKKALKLSRLPPEQQADAARQFARQLAEEKSRSSNDRHPALTESDPTEEQAPKPSGPLPDNRAPPALGAGYYPTIRDSVADLKNPDKDRSPTPSKFLAALSFSLQGFCQSVLAFTGPEHESVFPELTQEHLDQIFQEVESAHSALNNLYYTIERMAKNEQA